jgi:hypothetical protein
MKKSTIPSRSQFAVLRQICNLIPCHMVAKLARDIVIRSNALHRNCIAVVIFDRGTRREGGDQVLLCRTATLKSVWKVVRFPALS